MWHPEKKVLITGLCTPHFLTRHVEQYDVTRKRFSQKQVRSCTNKYFQYSKDVSRVVTGPSSQGMQRMTNTVPLETSNLRGLKSSF